MGLEWVVASVVAAVLLVAVISICASRHKTAGSRTAGQPSTSPAIGNATPQQLHDTQRQAAETDVTEVIIDGVENGVAGVSPQNGGDTAPSASTASKGATTSGTPRVNPCPVPDSGSGDSTGVRVGRDQAPGVEAQPLLQATVSGAVTGATAHSQHSSSLKRGVTLLEEFGDSATWDAYADQIQKMALPPPQTAATGTLVTAWRATHDGAESGHSVLPAAAGILGAKPMKPDEALARLAGKAAVGSHNSSPAKPLSSQQQQRAEDKQLPCSRCDIPGSLTVSGESKGRSLTGLVGAGALAALATASASQNANLRLHSVNEIVEDGTISGTSVWETEYKCTPFAVVFEATTEDKDSNARAGITPPSTLPTKGSGQAVAAPGPDVRTDIDLQQLDIGHEIGRGGFGRVYAGTYQGTQVAIKMLLGASNAPSELAALELEVSILSRANHPNVLKIYGCNLSPTKPFIVAELLMCSLHYYIYHPRADTRVLLVVRLAQGIAGALSYLHPAVLHRDLKPGNVLLGHDGIPKVADFGLARWKLKTLLSTQSLDAGSVPYLAPECYDPDNWHLTDRVDIYSFAIMMSEMLVRRPPWHGMSSMQVAWEVHVKGRRPELPPPGPQCPAALLNLIKSCWAQDPKRRPSAAHAHRLLTELHDKLQAQETGT